MSAPKLACPRCSRRAVVNDNNLLWCEACAWDAQFGAKPEASGAGDRVTALLNDPQRVAESLAGCGIVATEEYFECGERLPIRGSRDTVKCTVRRGSRESMQRHREVFHQDGLGLDRELRRFARLPR